MPHPLDNPLFESLSTHHQRFAVVDGALKRYPTNIGPFVAVGIGNEKDPSVQDSLKRLVLPGDLVYFLGPRPELGGEWNLTEHPPLPQLVCNQTIPVVDGPQIVELTEAHRAEQLALTKLVYPGFFRERTPELGGYLGIYQDGQLAAMAGERMHCHEFLEISAVCTHPDYLGRRYSQRLLATITNRALERGSTPFLHVSRENTRARAVYDRLGYRERTALPFVAIHR